jgi:hypothetical protein
MQTSFPILETVHDGFSSPRGRYMAEQRRCLPDFQSFQVHAMSPVTDSLTELKG